MYGVALTRLSFGFAAPSSYTEVSSASFTATPAVNRQLGTSASTRSARQRKGRRSSLRPAAVSSAVSDPSPTPVDSAIPTPGTATSISVQLAEGKTVTFESGRVARQAAGSVMVRAGDTMVLCTACASPGAEAGVDFLPLRVDYSEKFSSVGKTAGGFVKREGRPSEREVLTSRLIDRPLRPMFVDGYCNDVQVLANVFSYDGVNPGDPLAICGCAAALHISHIPLSKAVAGVRIAHVDGIFVVNPTIEEMSRSKTELVIAGTRDGILMIEGACDFLTEEQVLEALQIAHIAIGKLCDCLDELRALIGKEKQAVTPKTLSDDMIAQMANLSVDLDDAIAVVAKKPRERAMAEQKKVVWAKMAPTQDDRTRDPVAADNMDAMLRVAYKKYVSGRIRAKIMDAGIRPDGRDCFTVRPITIDQGYLPCTHGSSLFTRGETQALAVVTVGGDDMAQRYETLEGENQARFYLQYSFPPSSVGEVGRIGAPGRREIGHGKLAERALAAVLPPRDEFPYVLRVESSITESCGSSSMASVCGGCLALMDAGVPIFKPVAGIAMGLMIDDETGDVAILTDILGLEDALGDMDFKVAGTEDGITALQMDIKVEGISLDIMRRALKQAKAGRLHILREMFAVQPRSNATLPTTVPKVRSINIPVKRIGDVIGPGGRNIKAIIAKCGGENVININIEETGTVSFSSSDDTMIEQAMEMVKSAIATIEPGTRFDGTITKVLPFGCYISIGQGKEAWLHISDFDRKRTPSLDDVCKVGDQFQVQVVDVGRNGQLRVSRRACLPVGGQIPAADPILKAIRLREPRQESL
jgi:polyribonucleotide nucleotidyltransferase